MAHIRLTMTPPLENAILIAAFGGWNDAADAATATVQHLIRHWNARQFGSIESEEFFDFTETRPTVRYDRSDQRVIDWPANDFHFRRHIANGRDVVLLLGVEPQLRWKTFTSEIITLCQTINVTTVLTIGALLADVPHSRDVRLSGAASDSTLAARMKRLRLGGSRYEGPTGIVGVLNVACREAGLAAGSLWASVPHYVSARPNPRVTLAILQRLGRLLEAPLDLSEWETMARTFDEQVAQAVAENPEIAAYVEQLEQADTDDTEPTTSDLPSGEALVRELEEFLRQRRPDEPATGSG
jgi:proteasome assembly chaperone (PAC2) family protein